MLRTSVFSRLVRKSPLTPIRDHMRIVCNCVQKVPLLFEAQILGDRAAVEQIKQSISACEAEADTIKNELRAHLPKSLMMAVNRMDLLQLLQVQDAIAGVAQDIAGLVAVRKTEVPEFFREPLIALTSRCVEACEQSADIIEELDELLAVGFQGPEANRVERMVSKLSATESETDQLGEAIVRTLFQHEQELEPVSVLLWLQLFRWIGDIADYAEDVGDRVRLLVAH